MEDLFYAAYSMSCLPDADGCIRLSDVLGAFGAPIGEEQAWAICYGTVLCASKENLRTSCVLLPEGPASILLHKDGYVHPSTLYAQPSINQDSSSSLSDSGDQEMTGWGSPKSRVTTEYRLMTALGLALFHALDYGICEDEERTLSPALEELIDRMTGDDVGDDHDEGIEEDPPGTVASIDEVLQACVSRLPGSDQADIHYRAVIRALVAEAGELSTFLEKIAHGTKEFRNCFDAETQDASKLDALRIKDWASLWMQVIRELRQGVKLKKVEHNPHPIEFEMTPYEMLLDDIRSRRYKLNKVMVNGDIPPRVKKDARALILEFIRSRPPLTPASCRQLKPLPPRQLSLYEKLMLSLRQKHKLRPTRTRENFKPTLRPKETSPQDAPPQPQRRLIKPDPELSLLDDLEDIPSGIVSEPESPLHTHRSDDDGPLVADQRTRRHSISLCERIPSPEPPDPVRGRPTSLYQLSKAPARLILNLEEVVHIRHVLTKAELESMLFTKGAPFPLYFDLVKGKVCFCCKQTRFSFFGAKGITCKLCERTVCDKCSTRMRLPLECPASIPVCLLTPTPSPEEEQDRPLWRLKETLKLSSLLPKKVTHNDCINNNNGLRHSQSFTHVPPPRCVTPPPEDSTPLLPVCRDCKYMVCYIITPPELRSEPPSLSSDIIPL